MPHCDLHLRDQTARGAYGSLYNAATAGETMRHYNRPANIALFLRHDLRIRTRLLGVVSRVAVLSAGWNA